MKRQHETILGLISSCVCLVPLQFLLCPRFPNRNALIPPEQCLLVCTATLAPCLKAEPPPQHPGDTHCLCGSSPLV